MRCECARRRAETGTVVVGFPWRGATAAPADPPRVLTPSFALRERESRCVPGALNSPCLSSLCCRRGSRWIRIEGARRGAAAWGMAAACVDAAAPLVSTCASMRPPRLSPPDTAAPGAGSSRAPTWPSLPCLLLFPSLGSTQQHGCMAAKAGAAWHVATGNRLQRTGQGGGGGTSPRSRLRIDASRCASRRFARGGSPLRHGTCTSRQTAGFSFACFFRESSQTPFSSRNKIIK
jgi:hypothetical protein